MAQARRQRHGRRSAHQSGARAVERGELARGRDGGVRVQRSGVRPRRRQARVSAGADRRPYQASHRRGGGAGGEQQRIRRDARAGGGGGGQRGCRVARRSGGNRRRLPHPRRSRAERRAPRGSRDDKPRLREGFRERNRRGYGRDSVRPRIQLPRDWVHARADIAGAGRSRRAAWRPRSARFGERLPARYAPLRSRAGAHASAQRGGRGGAGVLFGRQDAGRTSGGRHRGQARVG